MLKITTVDDGAGQRLVVEGKLVAPWVSELESAWNHARQANRGCTIVVDLSGTTAIDPTGQAALMAMIYEGARLTAKGVYSDYVIQQLMNKALEVRAPGDTCNRGRTDSSSAKESSQAGDRSLSEEKQ